MKGSAIILCAGYINFFHLPISTNTSNSMIPINGKPVIGWILDDLINKHIGEVVIVLRKDDEKLFTFLKRVYSKRINLLCAFVTHGKSILHSIKVGIDNTADKSIIRVILGDTLILDSYNLKNDFVYFGKVSEAKRWCILKQDSHGCITELLDKADTQGENFDALAGYYQFTHIEDLETCLQECIDQHRNQISDLLILYNKQHPIHVHKASAWYDFGHIDQFIAAKQSLLGSRYFNKLTIDPMLNTITKTSELDDKLQDELNWYLNLPTELQVLTPRIISHHWINGKLEVVEEYYGYPTLAELYVYGELDIMTWNSILKRVFLIHKELCKYSGKLNKTELEAVYSTKTFQRINELIQKQPAWESFFSAEKIIWNEKELLGWAKLAPKLNDYLPKLIEYAPISIIHGDFCFSNILYDVGNQIIRLIDPRGSFGKKGIFGDARYDISKLRHSVCGFYDFIMSDLFQITSEGNCYSSTVYSDYLPITLSKSFDRMVQEIGHNLQEIKLIEGLLFISMLPLHQDAPKRQKMMALQGLSLLNESLI
jgi:dTDP-glucose pyrophosphorylase